MKAKNVPGLRWTEFFQNKKIFTRFLHFQKMENVFLHPMILTVSKEMIEMCSITDYIGMVLQVSVHRTP